MLTESVSSTRNPTSTCAQGWQHEIESMASPIHSDCQAWQADTCRSADARFVAKSKMDASRTLKSMLTAQVQIQHASWPPRKWRYSCDVPASPHKTEQGVRLRAAEPDKVQNLISPRILLGEGLMVARAHSTSAHPTEHRILSVNVCTSAPPQLRQGLPSAKF